MTVEPASGSRRARTFRLPPSALIPAVKILAAAAALLAVLAVLSSCSLDLDYDKYAIVYGVAEYDPSRGTEQYPNLQYTDDDALAMEDLLNQQGFMVSPYTRVDGDATKTNLQADFADIAAQASSDDLFLFYFSGHGGQIIPASPGDIETAPGSDQADEWIFLRNSILWSYGPPYYADFDLTINDDQLAALLRTIPCVRRIVILDACNSGGFIANAAEADAIPPDYTYGSDGLLETLGDAIYLYANFQDYGSDIPPGEALVIAASGERESSFEGYYDHGVMTYFLLESAARGDRNRDGYVTVTESYNYIYRKIQANWNNSWYGLSSDVFFPHVSGGPVDYVLFVD